MVWRIEFANEAAKELKSLDRPVAKPIHAFLTDRRANLDDPRSIGEALRGSELGQFWKYRVGDWRIVANIDDDVVRVLVLRIGHRRDIYR